MREIKFRGKTKQGEWVEGSYVYAHKWFGTDEAGHFITSIYGSDRVLVMPETIGQFTGLYDKNGKEIYEGDVVEFVVFDYNCNDKLYRGVVKWSDEENITPSFLIWKNNESEYYGNDGAFDLGCVVYQDDEFEVIGNIYDNPELIKG